MAPLYRAFKESLPASPPPAFIFFISASPVQFYPVLAEKFRLDGLLFDGITLKRWLNLIRKGRWFEIKKHIVYKLAALLYHRKIRPNTAKVKEILIGDDSENDLDAYILYTQIVNREISLSKLEDILKILDAVPEEKRAIIELSQENVQESQIERIYIHCSKYKRPLPLSKVRPELVFSALDPLQIALDAYQKNWISFQQLLSVAEELPPKQLEFSLKDAKERNIIDAQLSSSIKNKIKQA